VSTSAADQTLELGSWLDLLTQGDASQRRQAADYWARLGSFMPLAVPELTRALADPSPDVRESALLALGSLCRQAKNLLPLVTAALRRAASLGADETLRSLAAQALLAEGQSSRLSVTELLDYLNAPEAPLRFSAAQALGEWRAEAQPAVGRLLQVTLQDPDPGVRLEAAMALYRIGGEAGKVVPLLVNALGDASEVRRWIAADCLGEIGPAARSAAPALRAALHREEQSPLIRKALTLALEKIEGTAGS
jgi:HEAT repeat protein